MGILSWMVFGALAGWVAHELMGTRERSGCFYNMILGVVGAVVGGLLVKLLGGRAVRFEWDLHSFGVAVLGAVLLLALCGKRGKKAD